MSNMRRLARDHGALMSAPPPDYFLPPSHSLDDLTHLSIYLVGPTSTPYEPGVYHLTLKIPATYPAEPPKANFVTKIFHPNVCDRTGDVCVDTLKRDWSPKLTLTDVLVTIRCLLVYPNATSALNEAAGRLLLEDYEGFARHAKLMAEVHAMCPAELREAAEETRKRNVDENEATPSAPTPSAGITETGKSAHGNRAQMPTNVSGTPLSASQSIVAPASQSSVTTSTTPRRIKKPVSSASRPRVTSIDTSHGGDSGSDSESGKENVIGRVPSPTGSKRSRDDSDLEDNDAEDTHTPPGSPRRKISLPKTTSREPSGRKSPKAAVAETGAIKPKTLPKKTVASSSAPATGKRTKAPVARKVKIGLKRF